jgi:hypothetical protein
MDRPRKGLQPLPIFIFYFDLDFFKKRVQSPEPLNTKMSPIFSFFGRRLVQYKILSSYWLAHFYSMKKSAEEVGGLEVIFVWSDSKLRTPFKYSRTKLKIKNL